MKKVALGIALALMTAGLFYGLARLVPPPPRHPQLAPWAITVLPGGGARVFGIELGTTTLGEVRQVLGPRLELAVLAAPGEAGALEGYYSEIHLGGLAGKLVLGAQVEAPVLARMRARAVGASRLATGVRKFTLHPDDRRRALRAPVDSVTYVPVANLTAETLRRHFGEPAERINTVAGREHWLYPDQGLDVILDPEGKEVLQYVAPRAFGRVRAPLVNG